MRAALRALAAATVGLAALVGCGRDRPPIPVLLVSIDTLRPDHLGAYGYLDVETPNIDALARRGVLFAQATSPAPLTLPAHASIMTGTYPTYHGVRVNGNTALSPAQTELHHRLPPGRDADAGGLGGD